MRDQKARIVELAVEAETRDRMMPMLRRHKMTQAMGVERMLWLVEEMAARAQAGDFSCRLLLAEAEFDYTMIEVP